MEAEKSEEQAATTAVDMELEAAGGVGAPPEDGGAAGSTTLNNGVHENEENGVGKRGREDGGEEEEEEEAKRQKMEKSLEEERLESVQEGEKGDAAEGQVDEGEEDEGGDGEVDGAPVKLGPKSFTSSVAMFEYFYKLLHTWSPHLDINKYEFMVLVDLIKKGHPEPEKKIGGGIRAFHIRNHPMWKSKCFFVVRDDGSSDDFSFRKCVDHILPLPDNMKVPADGKRGGGSGNQKRDGGHGGGRGGRGGKWGGRRGGRGKRGGGFGR